MSFIIYDIAFLVIFGLFLAVFLYRGRKNLKKEGLLLLYKERWGINAINKIGSTYTKTLNFLQYVSISVGYVLMASVLFLLANVIYLYIKFPEISKAVKAPPIVPLFPYFPKVFGLQNFFPPFYATYFVLGIIIVATFHEFAHGIFAKFHKIEIKNTGLAFLSVFPLIFGAFVEPNEKQMEKKSKTAQLSILSAGVFFNVIIALIAYLLLIFTFTTFFVPAGAMFNIYPVYTINTSEIQSIDNISLENLDNQEKISLIEEKNIVDKEIGEYNLTEIKYRNSTFLIPVEKLKLSLNQSSLAVAFLDSPAIRAGFPSLESLGSKAAITRINEQEITDYNSLVDELLQHSPGETVSVEVIINSEVNNYEIVLGESPLNDSLPYLGVGIYLPEETGMRKFFSVFTYYRDDSTLYQPKLSGEYSNDLVVFIYDLFWWLALINLAVALFNMMPLGILDGGKFFYLTVLGITGSEKISSRSFALITYAILFVFLFLIFKWILAFF